MSSSRYLIVVSALGLSMACGLGAAEAATAHNSQAGAFGQSKNAGATTVGSRRIKHAAKHKVEAAAPEADRDAGMYVVKPQTPPEYFGHGTGSDGSMPQD